MTYFKRFTVIMLVVAMILGTAGIAAAAPADTVGLPCEDAVEYLMDLGVVAGYPDGTFQPARTLTRAEVAKIVVLTKLGDEGEALAGYLKGATSFSDVPADHWASGYIKLAQNLGIVGGYPDGTYKPGNPVTHIELVKMLVLAAGLTPGAGAWPTNYLTVGLAEGIVLTGVGADEPLTRCEMAQMVAHTIANVENPTTGLTLAQSVFGESMVATITLVPASSTVGIGGAVQFVATAKDADGATLTDVSITYTTNDPAKSAVNTTGLFVASASGTYTVTATAGAATGTATVAGFGAATALRATPETATVPANNETIVKIKVEVVDANGIVVADDDDTEITMDYDESNGAVDIDYDENVIAVENGVATFEVVATDAADVTDTLEFTADDEDIDEDTVEVTTVEQVATAIELEADPTELMANEVDGGHVTATVVDQAGELMLSGVFELTFSITGKGTLEGDTENVTEVTAYNGEAEQIEAVVEVASEKGDPGTFTITCTGAGLASDNVTVNTYIAGSPVALKIIVEEDEDVAGEEDLQYTVGLIDKWGHWTIADYDVELVVEHDADDEDFCGCLGMFEDPAGEGYITYIPEGYSRVTSDYFSGYAAGTWTITVSDDDDEFTAASFDVTVLAAEPYSVSLTPALDDGNIYLLISNPTMTFTAQVKDEFGNKVNEVVDLLFSAHSDSDYDYDVTNDGEITTDSTGKATATFTFDPYVGTEWCVHVATAEDEEWEFGDYSDYVVITDTVPGSISIVTENDMEDVISTIEADADDYVHVFVQVDDTNGNELNYPTLVEITFSNDGDNVQNVSELTDEDDGVYTGWTDPTGMLHFTFQGYKAGAFTITAKALETNGTVTATKSFRTKVGQVIAHPAIFNADGTLADDVELEADEPVQLKLSMVDNGDNVMVVPEDTYVALYPEAGEYRLTATGTAIEGATIGAGKTYKTIWFAPYVDNDEGADLSDDWMEPVI